MSKKQKRSAGHKRLEVKFILDATGPFKVVTRGGFTGLEAYGVWDTSYVMIPLDAEVTELPSAFLPGEKVKSKLSGIKFTVHSGPYEMAFGDTTVPAYLVAEGKGVQLIREHLLELDI